MHALGSAAGGTAAVDGDFGKGVREHWPEPIGIRESMKPDGLPSAVVDVFFSLFFNVGCCSLKLFFPFVVRFLVGWGRGEVVRQSWLPVDDRCMSPVSPCLFRLLLPWWRVIFTISAFKFRGVVCFCVDALDGSHVVGT